MGGNGAGWTRYVSQRGPIHSAMTIADRLGSLGIELPPPFPPAGNYLSCVIDEGLVYVGGHGPVAGDQMIRGKVGGDLTLEQGREAARMTALSILGHPPGRTRRS